MATFGISLMKDEEDICYWTVKQMLTQVDKVIVLDNNSSDGTRKLLLSLGVEVLDDPDPAHYQSKKMTDLAKYARNQGADWIIPFDADEIWYSPFYPRIADALARIEPQWLAVSVALYNQVPTGEDDLTETDLPRQICWRRLERGALDKVACRWRDDLVIGEGNHSAYYDGGTTIIPNQLVIRHYPYRSVEQFVRKARNGAKALALTHLDYSVGQHWRDYGNLLESYGEQVLMGVFYAHFYSKNPYEDETLIYDPAPISY
jgi:glycosyltransferase involved in cell wall biosynthesis